MIDSTVFAAGTRFGLGLKPGDAAHIGGDVGGWLMEQIRAPQINTPEFAALASSAKNMQYLLDARMQMKEAGGDKKDLQKALKQDMKGVFIDELRAKLQLAVTTDTPFYERLVDFWSNHFTVSIKKGRVAGVAGAYEREAIRPHVTGKFSDMLLGVARHPAMLFYLDNAQSVGPDSLAGMRQKKGLNENLAREIMELHTLGVDGGYSQTDVTSFARVLTGWSIGGLNSDHPGMFDFAYRRHEPGEQRVLARVYGQQGEEQGVAVLRDLAHHPATAHHIATKLVRHFVADEPPQNAVQNIAQVFLDTGGDLPEVYRALIALPQAWDLQANPKIKSGYDLVVSAARACGRSGDPYIDYALKSLKFLGTVPFEASSPAGMPDIAQDIAGPEAMIRRVEWAQMAAVKFEPTFKAADIAQWALGPASSAATRSVLQGARNEHEAVAIVFGSPDFQKR